MTEATLDGIPSLDFRPMLQLYAPSDAHLQMSPCGECGGTIEVSDNKLTSTLEQYYFAQFRFFFDLLNSSVRTVPWCYHSAHSVTTAKL